MSLRAVQEIEAFTVAGAAILDALTNMDRPRVVLVEPQMLDDYVATLRGLRRLERRLRRLLDIQR